MTDTDTDADTDTDEPTDREQGAEATDALMEALSDQYDDEDMARELVERADSLEADDNVDFDRLSRQAPGWMKIYVECPDCETPMARTTVESSNAGSAGDVDVTHSEIRAICPECREVMSILELTRKTGSFDDLA